MKGYSVRIEIGPKDIEKNQVVLVRRDTGEKEFVSKDDLETRLPQLLEDIQQTLYNNALEHREKRTTAVKTMEDMHQALEENQGFMKGMWCGDTACEEEIKDATQVHCRRIPCEQEEVRETCFWCGKEAIDLVVWATAY